jgi:hypothetical protein
MISVKVPVVEYGTPLIEKDSPSQICAEIFSVTGGLTVRFRVIVESHPWKEPPGMISVKVPVVEYGMPLIEKDSPSQIWALMFSVTGGLTVRFRITVESHPWNDPPGMVSVKVPEVEYGTPLIEKDSPSQIWAEMLAKTGYKNETVISS